VKIMAHCARRPTRTKTRNVMRGVTIA
jgi:hypothetical protein